MRLRYTKRVHCQGSLPWTGKVTDARKVPDATYFLKFLPRLMASLSVFFDHSVETFTGLLSEPDFRINGHIFFSKAPCRRHLQSLLPRLKAFKFVLQTYIHSFLQIPCQFPVIMSASAFGAANQSTLGVSRHSHMSELKFPGTHELMSFLKTHPWGTVWGVAMGIVVLLLINYIQALYKFHYQDRFASHDGYELSKLSKPSKPSALPPLYPSFIPFLGSAISFAWDNAAFIRRAA